MIANSVRVAITQSIVDCSLAVARPVEVNPASFSSVAEYQLDDNLAAALVERISLALGVSGLSERSIDLRNPLASLKCRKGWARCSKAAINIALHTESGIYQAR